MGSVKKEEGQLIMIDGINLMIGQDGAVGATTGILIAGVMREQIILGMKTNDGHEMGVILSKNNALEIASMLTKAACEGETKQ